MNDGIERLVREWLESTDCTDGHIVADSFARILMAALPVLRAAEALATDYSREHDGVVDVLEAIAEMRRQLTGALE